MNNRKWVRVGELFVDSGTIMVVDPCYVLPDKRDYYADRPFNGGLEYSDALGFDHPEDHPESYQSRRQAVLDGDYQKAFVLGGDNTKNGFFFGSGFGDGAYNIYALISDEGDWGTRVMGLFVDFDGSFSEYDLPTEGMNDPEDDRYSPWDNEDDESS